MRAIADALVYAVAYIDCRSFEEQADEDVAALESIAGLLHDATAAEQDALAAAADRALAAELASPLPRPELVREYQGWMEHMFDGWQGNRRLQTPG